MYNPRTATEPAAKSVNTKTKGSKNEPRSIRLLEASGYAPRAAAHHRESLTSLVLALQMSYSYGEDTRQSRRRRDGNDPRLRAPTLL